MAVWVVTGKLGGGKSLVSVSRIRDYLRQGRKVATNLDIRLPEMFGRHSKATLYRLPDKPTVFDMEAIGIGNESYDEEKNGLIVLDELGTWLNSRNWQDKTRRPLLDWFLHARKYGWDIIFIVQDVGIIDSQFRESLAEMTVFCRRMDRMSVPILGSLFKMLTGEKLPLPKVHVGRVVYGTSTTDMLIDRWVYRGTDLYRAYDTRQVFRDDYPYGAYSQLSPAYLNQRTKAVKNWGFYMRMTKIWWRRFASPVALAAGVLLGVSAALLVTAGESNHRLAEPVTASAPVDPEGSEGEDPPYIAKLKEAISSLYITGSMNLTGDTIYQLADLNDENAQTLMTSSDLVRMGLIIKGYGNCRLDVNVAGEVIPVFCLSSL